MDEDVKIQIGAGLPEWPQLFGIERQILQFRGDHGARESELDGAALQFGGGLRRLERRHMRQADKAAVMRQLSWVSISGRPLRAGPVGGYPKMARPEHIMENSVLRRSVPSIPPG